MIVYSEWFKLPIFRSYNSFPMGKKILKSIVVDDDSDDLDIFQAACQDIDPNVNLQTFQSCQNLFGFLDNKDFQPDIMFLDINMPVKDGFECLRDIRKTWNQNERCIIMYSTSNNPKDIKKCFEFGANGFIQKPYSYQGLKDILERIFAIDWSDPCENLKEVDFVISPNEQNIK